MASRGRSRRSARSRQRNGGGVGPACSRFTRTSGPSSPSRATPAIAATVFVCRAPLETPTGRYLGTVHIQRMLREPPHGAVGGIIDKDIETLTPEASIGKITRTLATYNLVSVPIVDEDNHLLGAVTVDDVLDHLLPDDWREERHEVSND